MDMYGKNKWDIGKSIFGTKQSTSDDFSWTRVREMFDGMFQHGDEQEWVTNVGWPC